MTHSPQAIGVLGGTFDPVHVGHLRLALEVREALGLDEVRLVPAGHPPHRQAPVATAAQRETMLRLALDGGADGLSLDRRELERQGPSYMVDTLASLRADLGPESKLYLILGMDAFAGLAGWHQWQRLSDYAHLAVVQRPGAEPALKGLIKDWAARRVVESGGPDSAAGKLVFVTAPQLDISASAIRTLCARQRDIRFLVPEAVRQYIAEQELYGPAAEHA